MKRAFVVASVLGAWVAGCTSNCCVGEFCGAPLSVRGPADVAPGTTVQYEAWTDNIDPQKSGLMMAKGVVWESTGAGTAIDGMTGLLSIDPLAEVGTLFSVIATASDGMRTELPVRIVPPVYGLWAEVAREDCAGGGSAPPSDPIGEVRFRLDGSFGVTWEPFETYIDYWGTYTFDAAAGTVDAIITDGNYVPADAAPVGTYARAGDTLVLSGFVFGTGPGPAADPPGCGAELVARAGNPDAF